MPNARPLLRAPATVLLPLALGACVSLSTFQSPRVLDPGETHLGAGVLVTGGDAGAGELAILARRGLADGVDLGGKLWGVPPFVGLYGDLRYQISQEPLLISGTLGASAFSIRRTSTEGDETQDFSLGVYPTVLVGSERFFGGVRWTHLFASAGDLEETYGTGFPGVIAGASFGTRVIFAPEVNVHLGDEALVLPGAAVHFRF